MEHIEKSIKDGKRAKTLRKKMGITQKDLANAIGVAQSNYCHMEYGRQNIGDRLEMIEKMYDAWATIRVHELRKEIRELILLRNRV